MREAYLKAVALLQVFLIVGSLFTIILITPQEVSAEQKVCCSETVSGDTCAYVDQSQCKPGAQQSATTCEQTSFCQLGCGFDQGSGKCFKNTPKFTCDKQQGCKWDASPTCDIPQCQLGCCVLSNECSFTTQLECKKVTSQFADVNMTFKQEITSEVACINQCRSFERGACVAPDGSCTFTTRAGCSQTGGLQVNVTGPKVGFHPDKLCSQPDLGTECAAQQYTGCLADREEVYWFDSCGNPENIYSSNKQQSYNNGYVLTKEQSCNPASNNVNSKDCGNCNYIGGSLCMEAPTGQNKQPTYGKYICGDISCGTDDITQEKTAPASNSPKKVGESWCSYDGVPGFGRDLVGSRHYRRLCINGKELTESCKDFREEMCVQGVQGQPPLATQEAFGVSGGGYVEAACRENRFQDCTELKWIEPGDRVKQPNAKKDCENLQFRDCVWLGNDNTGRCVPVVSPGLKFWTGESTTESSKQDAKAICNQGNTQCTVVYAKGGVKSLLGGDYKCEENCECLEKPFFQSANNFCKSLGDCGSWFNIEGKFTNDGSIRNIDGKLSRLLENDVESYDSLVGKDDSPDNPYENKFGLFFKKTWLPIIGFATLGVAFAAVTGEFAGLLTGFTTGFGVTFGYPLSLLGGNFGKLYSNAINNWAPLVEVQTKTYQTVFEEASKAALSNPTEANVAAMEAAKKNLEKYGADTVAETTLNSAAVTILNFISIALTLWTIYNLIDIFLAKDKTETVSISCEPWVAPLGGDDCEKCGNDGKECSEYRCKSLGQMCTLLNPGTKNEMCVSSNPNDVTSPQITADKSVLLPGFTITEVANEGFTLNQDIPPFTAVKIGVKTNEPAQCKYSLNTSTKFEQMTSFFGGSLYNYNHTELFALPGAMADEQALKLTNSGRFTLYLRCQDGNGNENNKDYYIRFKIAKGPDLTAPVIELTSIQNGAYAAAGVNETALAIYLNEPSECKWDDIDGNYDDMTNGFTCKNTVFPTSSIYYGLYDCATMLKPIKDQLTNNFYFRCRDQPGASTHNEMVESYLFTLQGTQPLSISSIQPSGTLYDPNPTLSVVTSKGAQGGAAICGYSFSDSSPGSMITFLNTNSTLHEQPFTNLSTGSYTAYVNCFDVAGNLASGSTSFAISVDTQAPQLDQIYADGTILHVVTNEESSCEYSSTGDFSYGGGIPMTGAGTMDHELTIEANLYYVKCADSFGNVGSYVISL